MELDILRHYDLNRQTLDVFLAKMHLKKELLQACRLLHPTCDLYPIGSTINGLGSFNSDMDLCLVVFDSTNTFIEDHSFSWDVLSTLAPKLRRCCCVQSVTCIKAKVPILRLLCCLAHDKGDLCIEVDMSCNNRASIFNSYLLHYYAQLSCRFSALALIVKHWSIVKHLCDARSGTLNSYSMTLLLLHYLQTRQPPVVLNLQEHLPHLFRFEQPTEHLQLFLELPAELRCENTENNSSVAHLLVGFFSYYSNFPFKDLYISIRDGCTHPRHLLPPNDFYVYIEEPFDLSNTARTMRSWDKFAQLICAFRDAADALRRNATLNAIGVVL